MRNRNTQTKAVMLLVAIAHILLLPLTHIESPGGEMRVLGGYYLADYDLSISMTRLGTRGEVFIPFVISLIVRFCEAVKLPIDITFYLALWSFPLINLTAIFFAYLLGSSLFDEQIGEYFGTLLGLSYFFFSFSYRTAIETVCSTLMLASTYFFWKCCKEERQKWYWFMLWGLFSAFSFETSYFSAFLISLYISFILLSKRINWLRNLNVWLSVVVGLLSFFPLLYLNHIHTGSLIGPVKNLIEEGYGVRNSRFAEYGHFLYLSYLRVLPSVLPFPNIIFFAYGIYLLLKASVKAEIEPALLSLLYLLSCLGGMTIMVTYFVDWYLPILIPPLLLITSVGLRGAYRYLSSLPAFERCSSQLWYIIFLISAITINQRHPFFLYQVLGNALLALNIISGGPSFSFSIDKPIDRFFFAVFEKLELTNIEGLWCEFVYPRLVGEHASGRPLQRIFEMLEQAGRLPRSPTFYFMVIGYYTLLGIALILSLYAIRRENLFNSQGN